MKIGNKGNKSGRANSLRENSKGEDMEEKILEVEKLEGQPEEGETPLSQDDIMKMIQSETDKVRTEYSQKVKQLEKEKEDLEKAKLTEEEKREYEIKKAQEELDKQTALLHDRELTIKTVDILKDVGLPIEAKDLIKGADEEDTKTRAEAFKALVDAEVKKQVDALYKGAGREVDQGLKTKPTIEMSMEEYAEYWKKRKK